MPDNAKAVTRRGKARKFVYDVFTNVVSWVFIIVIGTVAAYDWFNPGAVSDFMNSSAPMWSVVILVGLFALLVCLLIWVWRVKLKSERSKVRDQPAGIPVVTTNDRFGVTDVEHKELAWRAHVMHSLGKLELLKVEGPYCPDCSVKLIDHAPFEWWGIPALLGNHYWRCDDCGFRKDTGENTEILRLEVKNSLVGQIHRNKLGPALQKVKWD